MNKKLFYRVTPRHSDACIGFISSVEKEKYEKNNTEPKFQFNLVPTTLELPFKELKAKDLERWYK